MNYRVEAFFDDSKLSASEVSLICVFDKTEYEKFQDLSDDKKERYMKKYGGLSYRNIAVDDFGESLGFRVTEEAED